MLETVILTFTCKRNSKPAPPLVIHTNIPEDAARYLQTSEVVEIEIGYEDHNRIPRPDIPGLFIPGGQAFREHIILPSKKERGIPWLTKKPLTKK